MKPATLPTHSPPTRGMHRRLCGAICLFAFVVGVIAFGLNGTASPPTGPSGKEPLVGSLPLFDSWPGKGSQNPEAAIILTGQTFGLLQPCGCSRPQKGGLERRMQFIDMLKAKKWPVAGIDLGDIYPDKASFLGQGLLRYKTTMQALNKMGYIAVGVGKTEFNAEIIRVLGQYAVDEKPPYLLAGNLLGFADGKSIPREKHFKPDGLTRSMIGLAEVAQVGSVNVGVAGIIGRSLAEEVETKKLDTSVTFEKDKQGKVNNAGVLQDAVGALQKKNTQLNILIYQGTTAEAEMLAAARPEFHVILCQANDSEPPQHPKAVVGPKGQKTLIIEVGHKGRYVGVLGVFKQNGGLELHYQIVPLEEFYLTPGPEAAAQKTNPILPLLENYSKIVRDEKFLNEVPRNPHPVQIAEPKLNLTYVGSDACKACHAAEHKLWDNSKHGHALDTLEKVAKRPSLRNYDPECVRCHTVGFDYKTGYEDEKKTPNLKHVGCENCHGPGSGHVADPKSADLLALMSPWKAGESGAKLPLDLIKKQAEMKGEDRGKIAVPPAQQRMINIAANTCGKCHDQDNDPNFDFQTYWLKVNHSGLAPPGGWPAVAPKKNAPPPKK